MADIKFSQFISNTTPALTDEVVGLQGGVNKRITLHKVKDLFLTGLTTNYLLKKSESGLINSLIFDTGNNIGIGTITPTIISGYRSVAIDGTNGTFNEFRQNGTVILRVGVDFERPFFAGATNAPMDFLTNGVERVRIASSGELLVGKTTTNGARFQVNGDMTTSAPSGGSAGKWKLGQKATATVVLITTDYLQVEVDGVAYKLALVS